MPSGKRLGVAPQKRILVTAEHIARAEPCNRNQCAVKLAIQDTLEATRVSVDRKDIALTIDNERLRYRTPLAASEAIRRFDKTRKMKPFTLTLRDGFRFHAGQQGSKSRQRPTTTKARKAAHKGTKRVLLKTRTDGYADVKETFV